MESNAQLVVNIKFLIKQLNNVKIALRVTYLILLKNHVRDVQMKLQFQMLLFVWVALMVHF